jgi:hypothetical protein
MNSAQMPMNLAHVWSWADFVVTAQVGAPIRFRRAVGYDGFDRPVATPAACQPTRLARVGAIDRAVFVGNGHLTPLPQRPSGCLGIEMLTFPDRETAEIVVRSVPEPVVDDGARHPHQFVDHG